MEISRIKHWLKLFWVLVLGTAIYFLIEDVLISMILIGLMMYFVSVSDKKLRDKFYKIFSEAFRRPGSRL